MPRTSGAARRSLCVMRRDPASTGEDESAAPTVMPAAGADAPMEPHAPSGTWGVAAAALLGAVVPQTWFRAGTFIAAGDTFPMLQGLRGVTRLWGTEFVGTGSTGFASSQLLERGLVDVVDRLGGSPELAQRLWFTLVLAVCAASVAWLAMAFTRRPAAVFAAGAVAVLNPFVLVSVPNLQPIIAVACMALLVGFVVRLARGEHVPALLGVGLATWSAELARTPPLLALVATVAAFSIVLLVFLGEWRATVRVAGSMLAGAMFWAVPVAIHHLTGSPGIHPVPDPSSTSNVWSTAHGGPSNVLTLVASWAWGDAQQVGTGVARLARFPWSLMRWALPAAAVVGVIVAWRRLVSKVLAAAIPVLVILASGSNPPFLPVYEFFHDIVPGYEMFRQPMSKFGVLLVLCLAVAVAVGLDESLDRWSQRAATPDDAQPLLPLAMLCAAAVVFVHPLYLGTVIPGERDRLPSARVDLPDSWPQAGAALDALPGQGATLVLPSPGSFRRGTTWGFYGIDDLVRRLSVRPAVQLLPNGYQEADGASPALVREAESALANGDARTLRGAMQALGTRYLAVRTDTTAFGANRDSYAGSFLVAAAQRLGLAAVGSFEHVELFEVPPAARFSAATTQVSIVSNGRTDPNEATAVAASLLADGAVVTDDGPSGTAWVPNPGEAGLSIRLEPGRYESRLVSRGPAMWRATVDGRTVRMVPADTAEVGGDSLLDPTPVELTANRTPFGLLVGNDPQEGAGRLLVPLQGDTEVQVAAGAPVSLVTEAPSIVDLSDVTAQRCPRLDGPPVGVSPSGSVDAAASSVTITAPRATVCVAVPVRPPAAIDGKVRWVLSFGYRTDDPGAAKVCVYSSTQQKCLAGSRLAPDAGAGTVRTLVDAIGDLGDVQLILTADPTGIAGSTATSVAFRDVSLAPLQESGDPVAVAAPIGTPPVTTVEPFALPIVIGVRNDVGDLLGDLSTEATDCDRYDDEPARIDAETNEEDGSLRLQADRHSACVAAPVRAPAGVRDVVTTFEYRTEDEGVARIELQDSVTNEVVSSVRLPATSFWVAHQVHFLLPPAPIGRPETLQLVLVVQGPRQGEPSRTVDAAWRQVRMLPTQPFAFAVMPVVDAPTDPPVVNEIDDRFVSVRASDDMVLTFQQAWSQDWSLDGLPAGTTAEHVLVNGWANGWVLRGLDGRGAVLEVTHRYEDLVMVAVWSMPVVWALALVSADWALIVRRRRRHAGAPDPADGSPAADGPDADR